MRIYLAASCACINEQYRTEVIKKNPPLYLLETFFNGERICAKVLNDVGTDNFLLDSGAFSFTYSKKNVTHKEMEMFVDRQINFINDFQVKNFFEMDVDQVLGYDKVLEIRKRIEAKTQRQVIPVWHTNRGVENFKDLCKEYKYIGIGGIALGKNLTVEQIIKLVTYARERGVKVHGLGFTRFSYLNKIPWYSVDSCAWSKTAIYGGNICCFNGHGIKNKPIVKRGLKLNIPKLAAWNFNEWIKYQKYMDTKRW